MGDSFHGYTASMSQALNFDHNATTPILPAVADAVREASLQYPGNPASPHALGRAARRAVEDARRRIGELLGARMTGREADRVVFTSGGTEANNLAIRGILAGVCDRMPRGADAEARLDLVASAIEHPSVAGVADALADEGRRVERLGVDADGVVRREHLELLLQRRPRLVSVMLANNETGVIQPLAAITPACRSAGALVHTDAVQVAGKLPIDFATLGVDALTLSAHKFHGPGGIGALVLSHGTPLVPQLRGGFQQLGERPGTESPALALGMLAALEAWSADQVARRERLEGVGRTLVSSLQQVAGMTIVGAAAERLPHTLCVAFAGVDRQALVMALDLEGVAVSTGSACASGSSEPSPTLAAMGLAEGVISGAIRLSWGATTTIADAGDVARRILMCVNRLRRQETAPFLPAAANEQPANRIS